MKVATCSIVKQENIYIREFVEYNKKIGFDNVIIYDHNEGDEDLNDVIGDYIKDGFVILRDWSGHKLGPAVMEAFQDCVDKNKNNKEFDWILFIDNDEYLCFNYDKNVKEYLSRNCFYNVDLIKINWLNMCDSGHIYYEDKPLNERFTIPSGNSVPEEFVENKHIKTFVNFNSPYIDLIDYLHGGPHCPCRFRNGSRDYGVWITELKITDNAGNPLDMWEQIKESKIKHINFNLAYLKHFRFKTIEEHCFNKLEKLTLKGYTSCNFGLNLFFRYNDYDKRKVEVFNEYINKLFPTKVALIVCFRHEERHIDEFLKYYINLGIDKIFVCNLNEENYKNDIEDYISKDIDKKYYKIINYSHVKITNDYNNICYDEIYQKEKNNFNWFITVNMDEFLYFKEFISIKQFLTNEENNNADIISVPIITKGTYIIEKYFKSLNEDIDKNLTEVYEHNIFNNCGNIRIFNSKNISNINIDKFNYNLDNLSFIDYEDRVDKVFINKYIFKCPVEYIDDLFNYFDVSKKNNTQFIESLKNNCINIYILYLKKSINSRRPFEQKYLYSIYDKHIEPFFKESLSKLFDEKIANL